jgi:hypothetical protein
MLSWCRRFVLSNKREKERSKMGEGEMTERATRSATITWQSSFCNCSSDAQSEPCSRDMFRLWRDGAG